MAWLHRSHQPTCLPMGDVRVARPCWSHPRGASIGNALRQTAISPRHDWSTGTAATCAWRQPTFRPAP
eukprot:4482346-Alexandrium_andersonii.AAC.1